MALLTRVPFSCGKASATLDWFVCFDPQVLKLLILSILRSRLFLVRVPVSVRRLRRRGRVLLRRWPVLRPFDLDYPQLLPLVSERADVQSHDRRDVVSEQRRVEDFD